MVKKLQAIMDRVIIRLDEVATQTEGGVLLTDEVKKPQTIGTVESIGKDVKSIKRGDKVFFHIFDELPTPEAGVVIVREKSLLGIIQE